MICSKNCDISTLDLLLFNAHWKPSVGVCWSSKSLPAEKNI